jgi:hypothetical protein
VEALFELIKGLIRDMDGTQDDDVDEEDFKEEQNSVARLIHMLHNDDEEEMLKVGLAVYVVYANIPDVSVLKVTVISLLLLFAILIFISYYIQISISLGMGLPIITLVNYKESKFHLSSLPIDLSKPSTMN